jgi:hypothetical protein
MHIQKPFCLLILGPAADESRSNVRHPAVSRTRNHQKSAEIIGTGFIGGTYTLFTPLSLCVSAFICGYLAFVIRESS